MVSDHIHYFPPWSCPTKHEDDFSVYMEDIKWQIKPFPARLLLSIDKIKPKHSLNSM